MSCENQLAVEIQASATGADMDLRTSGGSEWRFSAFAGGLVSVIGYAERARPLFDCRIGLIMPGEHKGVEPMAAVTAPDRTSAQHQSLLHFVGQSPWSDEGVLAKVGEMVLPAMERRGPIEAWIIDDTGFPKKGAHSVDVARQYCGQLGEQDNCQVAAFLSLANHHPVCRRCIVSICRRIGQQITNVGTKRACPRRSALSRRSHLSKSKQPAEPGLLAAWC
ncbi:hypothetical protein ABIB85_007677 [Bradyrhizobium sp. JR1.5]